jgi:hypothetical protein
MLANMRSLSADVQTELTPKSERTQIHEITTESGEIFVVDERDLRSAVLEYSAQVQQFYQDSASKEPEDDEDRKGFLAMMSEWRRNHAEQNAQADGENATA